MDIEPAKGKSRNHGFLTADYTDTPYPCNPCYPWLTSVAALPRCVSALNLRRLRAKRDIAVQRGRSATDVNRGLHGLHGYGVSV